MKLARDKSGFTMIELLIGITVSAFIFIGSSSLMFALFTSNNRVNQQSSLEQAKNDIEAELSKAVRWAKAIQVDQYTFALTVENSDGTTNTYARSSDGTLTKDGAALTAKSINVISMTIDDYSKDSKIPQKSLVITLELENKEFKAIKDTVRIVASQRLATDKTEF